MEIELRYLLIPLANIPFTKIKGLENLGYQTLLCSEYYVPNNNKMCFVTMYECFDLSLEKKELPSIMPVFFGPVFSDNLPRRGINKCESITKSTINIELSDLPHLRYTSKVRDSPKGNWFYCSESEYYVFAAKETTYEKARHLEPITYYGDWVIRLRLVLELIKKKIKHEGVSYSKEELNEIAYVFLKAEPTLSKLNDEEIWNGVHNWVGSMMITPLYEDIPNDIRGRIIS